MTPFLSPLHKFNDQSNFLHKMSIAMLENCIKEVMIVLVDKSLMQYLTGPSLIV